MISVIKNFAFGAVLCSLGAIPATAREPISLVADEWPPFSGSDLPGLGIAMDVTTAVLTRAGYQVDAAILPWPRIVYGAKTAEYDIVTSLFLDAEMQEFLHYSDPFYDTEVRFVQKKGGDALYDGLASLTEYTIAVGADFLYEPAFDAADFLNKVEVATTFQGMQMVVVGRVDLTLDSLDVVRHSIQLGDPALFEQIEMLEPPLTTQQIHMAVSLSRPDHRQIVSDFNATLAEMRADGSLADLLAKHSLE